MRIGTKDIIHDGFVALQKIAQNMQCYGVQKQRMRALVRRLPRFENTAVIAQIPTSNHVSESPYLYEIFVFTGTLIGSLFHTGYLDINKKWRCILLRRCVQFNRVGRREISELWNGTGKTDTHSMSDFCANIESHLGLILV